MENHCNTQKPGVLMEKEEVFSLFWPAPFCRNLYLRRQPSLGFWHLGLIYSALATVQGLKKAGDAPKLQGVCIREG